MYTTLIPLFLKKVETSSPSCFYSFYTCCFSCTKKPHPLWNKSRKVLTNVLPPFVASVGAALAVDDIDSTFPGDFFLGILTLEATAFFFGGSFFFGTLFLFFSGVVVAFFLGTDFLCSSLGAAFFVVFFLIIVLLSICCVVGTAFFFFGIVFFFWAAFFSSVAVTMLPRLPPALSLFYFFGERCHVTIAISLVRLDLKKHDSLTTSPTDGLLATQFLRAVWYDFT